MADTVVFNARIRTMDPTRPRADWVLIRNCSIAALGTGAPPEAEERIDAGGRLVLPGFQDAHIHLLSGGIDLATAAYLYDVGSEAELIAKLRTHAAAKSGMVTMRDDGQRWVQAGVTSLDEVIRVTRD